MSSYFGNAIQNNVLGCITSKALGNKSLTRAEMSSDSEEIVPLNAEWATFLAEGFLKRLGYKRGLLPKKVSLTGEKYVVEVEFKKRMAKVQIDTKTREIKEYEIQELATESGFSLSRRNMLLILGVSAAIVVVVLKFVMHIF